MSNHFSKESHSVIERSQIPLHEVDFHLMGFEACNKLFEFTCLSFGCADVIAIASFHPIDSFSHKNSLPKTYCYIDDIIIEGETKEEHDYNLAKFQSAAEQTGRQPNKLKYRADLKSTPFLEQTIEKGMLEPNPERYQTLLNLKNLAPSKELKHLIRLFACYAKWIPNCSEVTMNLMFTLQRASKFRPDSAIVLNHCWFNSFISKSSSLKRQFGNSLSPNFSQVQFNNGCIITVSTCDLVCCSPKPLSERGNQLLSDASV
ncbi:Hypothetical predicted protein [Octopus vulgaris]|uniref:Reverse transcriptase domain-containing protein n=1 Tax=Octopus vulgaris TaxID=6645 RepID=A0AA36B1M8_OCTVU|nr:Hypothetical predicted protein [Octopus vulgaris]